MNMKFQLSFLLLLVTASSHTMSSSSRSKRPANLELPRVSLLKSFSPRTPTPRIEPIFTQEAFKSHDQSVKEIWNILQKKPDWNVDQAIADQYHDYLITLDQTSKALLQAHINYIEQRIWQQTSGDRYKSYKDHQIMMEVIYKNALKLHAYGTESGE